MKSDELTRILSERNVMLPNKTKSWFCLMIITKRIKPIFIHELPHDFLKDNKYTYSKETQGDLLNRIFQKSGYT